MNLQYRIALGWAGLEDGNGSESTADRVESVLAQQDRWRRMKWLKKTSVLVDFNTTYVYELSGGTFVLGHGGDDAMGIPAGPGAPPATQSLNIMQLPLAVDVQQGRRFDWRRTELGSRVADFGMDVEQDLLILIEPAEYVHFLPHVPKLIMTGLSFLLASGIRPIRVHFRTFSTNQPHPAAATPIFEYPCEIPHSYQFVIHIVGPHVGILFSSSLPDSDRLIIYSWTMGYIRAVDLSFTLYSSLILTTPSVCRCSAWWFLDRLHFYQPL